jgi:hypothetical protein
MSGISSITSSPSSGTSSALSTTGLSSVGASLLTTGQAPNVAPAAAPAPANTLSSYQAQYLSLQAYDTSELLYASFLSPAAGLANADSVLAQAAQLLGTPGSPAASLSTTPAASSSSTSSSTTAPASGTSSSSSTSSSSASLNNLPSVASILAASDQEAQQTLQNYANAPVGSSIIDYQA